MDNNKQIFHLTHVGPSCLPIFVHGHSRSFDNYLQFLLMIIWI